MGKHRKETREDRLNKDMEKIKEKKETEKREIAYGVQLRLANKKNDYIRNLINGRYYLARVNMIAEQINSKNIQEKIDGCPKTEEYMRCEYALMKMQAIMSMRNSHFAKQDLFKDFNLTEEEVVAIETDYYDGKIIREEYDDEYKRRNKAEFVSVAPEDEKS